MKTLAGAHIHLAILAAAAVVTTGMRMALHDQQVREFNSLGRKATEKRAREAAAYWNTFSYADAGQPGFADKFVASVNFSGLTLSKDQDETLRSRLRQTISYLTNPSAEAYWQLRTEGLHYQFKPTADVQAFWTNTMIKPGAARPEKPFDVVNAIFESMSLSNHLGIRRICAVCLTNISVAIALTNTPNSLLGGTVRKGYTAAWQAANLGIEYKDTPVPTPSPSGAPLYFHLSFYAKASNRQNSGPVYVAFSWRPEDHAWSIDRLMSDSWLLLNIPF